MNLLEKTTQLEQEADDFGFSWENHDQIIQQIQSECLEINAHLTNLVDNSDNTKLQEEIGDLLHATFSLCFFCQFDPEETLEKAILKFERRLNAVKQIAKRQGLTTLKGYSFTELMTIWEQAKNLVG